MNHTQIFEFQGFEYNQKIEKIIQRPMGRILLTAQHCSGQWPMRMQLARAQCAHAAHWRSRPKACVACPLARCAARVTAWLAAVLPWLRWGAQASTSEGSPVGQVGEGGSSPELLADAKGGKIRDGGGVLRRGECSGGWRGPTSEWEGRGSSGAGVPKGKGGKGVLGAPLTMEWVTTAEAAEVQAVGRLLAVSSYTDSYRVVRSGSRLRRKMWWHGDAGKAAA
jgi:hypothetical protein